MNWVYAIDLIGTLVFAISGVLTAIDKKFDLVGSIVIGAVTAIGGGTLRDVLIGETPVGWMKDHNYLIAIVIAVVLSYLFKEHIIKLRRGMFLFDTIGIGLFTVLGVQKALALGLSIPVSLLMGVVSAVFGGVTRDVLTNEIPLIFRKEIYASACLIGGGVYVSLEFFSDYDNANLLVSMLVVFIIRYLSVRNGWSLKI